MAMSLLMVDMDGTIREPLSGQQYFQHPLDQRIISGADERDRSLQRRLDHCWHH